MAIKVSRGNRLKALRYFGMANAKKRQALTVSPTMRTSIAMSLPGASTYSVGGAAPHVNLQASGERDSITFYVWDTHYDYGTEFPGTFVQAYLKYDPVTFAPSVHSAFQRKHKEDTRGGLKRSKYSPTVDIITSYSTSAGSVYNTFERVPSALSRSFFLDYGQMYEPASPNWFHKSRLVSPTTLLKKEKMPTETPLGVFSYVDSDRGIHGSLYTEPSTILEFHYLSEDSYVSTQLIPPNLGEDTQIKGMDINRDKTKIVLWYKGRNSIPANDPNFYAMHIKVGYIELTLSYTDNKISGVSTSGTHILYDSETALNSDNVLDIKYNKESLENELVFAYVQALGLISNVTVSPVDSNNYYKSLTNKFEDFYMDGHDRGSYRYTNAEYYLTESGSDLVFESITLGELARYPLSYCPFAPALARELPWHDTTVRSMIQGIDASCRGATIATTTDDAPVAITLLVGVEDTAITEHLDTIGIPKQPSGIHIYTTAFGVQHTVHSSGYQVDILSIRPNYPAISSYNVHVDMIGGFNDQGNQYYSDSIAGHHYTVAEYSSIFPHPHADKKLWVVSIDPGMLWGDVSGYKYLSRYYRASWLSAHKSSTMSYGGVYSASGEMINFKDIYDDLRAKQETAENSGSTIVHRMPEISLVEGSKRTGSMGVFLFNTDSRFTNTTSFSKTAAGVFLAVYEKEPVVL